MTTTTAVNDILPPSLYNIQYPNCRAGMFSLREPFKNVPQEVLPAAKSARLVTPAAVQPVLPNKEKSAEPIQPRQKSKRNAEVQCTLLSPNAHHDMGVQTKIDRQQPVVNYVYDDSDVTPRYQRRKKIQPVEEYEQVYEIWDVESPPPVRTVPINQIMKYREIPRGRLVQHRKPIIEYPDEEETESDYDEERIVYARQPRKTIKKTYLPPNVRMICVRDDGNRVSY